MDWITFDQKLPALGDDIEIIFGDQPLDFGPVTRLIDVTEVNQLAHKAWSISSNAYPNAVVRESYQWRIK